MWKRDLLNTQQNRCEASEFKLIIYRVRMEFTVYSANIKPEIFALGNVSLDDIYLVKFETYNCKLKAIPANTCKQDTTNDQQLSRSNKLAMRITKFSFRFSYLFVKILSR